MMPNMMGQPEIPKVEELWKNEKSKYRHWVILLGVGLFVIASIVLAAFIYNIFDKDKIIDALKPDDSKKSEKELTDAAEYAYRLQFLGIGSIIMIAVTGGFFLYLYSLMEVYKQKNFARLSSIPTSIVGIGAFMSFINLMMILFRSNVRGSLNTTGGVLTLVSYILLILIYIFASAPIVKIRRLFLLSERVNDPQFKAMQQQMMQAMQQSGGMNPYMPPVTPKPTQTKQTNNQTTNTQQSQQPQQPTRQVEQEISEEDKRLNKLKISQLRKVAKELSISGYETMKRNELQEAIKRVTSTDKK